MIIIGNALLSDDLYLERFVCELPVCLGGCCVEGEAGAPLEEAETQILQEIFSAVRPFMIAEGIDTVLTDGVWVRDKQGEHVTPLVQGRQCAYVYYDDIGIAKCAIERAFEKGVVEFRKPISCHLYPIRVTKYPHYDALNYHQWPICKAARKNGKKLDVRIFRFCRDALVRKYGQDWYDELEAYVDLSGF